MKERYLGEHGHIAIATNSINRAIAYLKRKGISILPDTAKESEGKLKSGLSGYGYFRVCCSSNTKIVIKSD